jgi:hypothetical protein
MPYIFPFIISQQRFNRSFIKLKREIIQLESELFERNQFYYEINKKKQTKVDATFINQAINESIKAKYPITWRDRILHSSRFFS